MLKKHWYKFRMKWKYSRRQKVITEGEVWRIRWMGNNSKPNSWLVTWCIVCKRCTHLEKTFYGQILMLNSKNTTSWYFYDHSYLTQFSLLDAIFRTASFERSTSLMSVQPHLKSTFHKQMVDFDRVESG